MKKLGKLKLNNFSEMSEQEMKFVVGGRNLIRLAIRSREDNIKLIRILKGL